jgi:predicted ATPase/DNA-binding SARP family transcriptional activator
VDIELLGRPAVRLGGERVELKGRQPALLAALAIATPRPVTSHALLEAVWGDDLPDDPANALQQRISALRRTIDPERTGALITVPGGYALRVRDDAIDARRSARSAAEGRELLVAGQLQEAHGRLTEALALWRGGALAGVAEEPWAIAEARRLEELRLVTIEDRNEASLALGAGVELVAELTELVEAQPLRERLSGQLMRALYRAGRQAEALAHFERIRRLLADELGVDPSPELQRLHLQLLEQADDLEVTAVSTRRPARPTGNLPAATTPVIGRDAAIDRVAQLLDAGRLVTLTGPGGAGKTTLALEVARRLPAPTGGIRLVELAPLTSGAAVVHQVATGLGLVPGGLGASMDADALVGTLTDRDLLLVLDNCEHVVVEVAELATALLARAPGVRVLATSREPLAVRGELVWSLPTLALPDEETADLETILAAPAVELLVDRIRAHDPSFELDEVTAPAAAAIVRRLDGLPLAIELAAARHRVLSLPDLADALDDRFAVLSTTQRGAPSRQRTLRGALDWSWELLDPDQRSAWAALAVPVDGVDRATAAALLEAAGVGGHPLDVVAGLVDRSLLTVQTTRSATRYRMLESVRHYGRERLRDLGDDTAVRARHADVIADKLAGCHGHPDREVFEVDLDELAGWLDEARAALRWASDADDRDRVQRLAGRLGWLWLLGGLATEGVAWLDRGLGARDGAPPDDIDLDQADPTALLWASGLRTTGLAPHGHTWAALALEAALGPTDRILAELFAAIHRAHAGDIEAALTGLRSAVEHATAIGGWVLGFAHLLTAQIGRLAGRPRDVREHAETGLDLLTDERVSWARVQGIDILIDAIDPTRHPDRARQLAAEGLALCRRGGFPELEGRMLLQLGVATHAVGDPTLARSYLDEAVELTEQAGRGPSLGFALLVAGSHARDRDELDLSFRQLTHARELLSTTGLAYGSARAALELGRTLLARGEPEAAGELAAEATRLASEVGDPALQVEVESFSAAVEGFQMAGG